MDGTDTNSPQVETKEIVRSHRIFVYGTLKRGQPNHYNFNSSTVGGKYKFIGHAQTTQRFPLIVATRWNLPFLLYAPGQGKVIEGEVYDVDDHLLMWMDSFEGHPEVYERDLIDVNVSAKSTTVSNSEINNERCNVGNEYVDALMSTCRCWAYFLKRYDPQLAILESHNSYDAFGIHGKPYQPDQELTGPDSIERELKLECNSIATDAERPASQ